MAAIVAVIAVVVLAAAAAVAVFALRGDDDSEITTATTDETDSTESPPTTVATTAPATVAEVTTTVVAPATTDAPATTTTPSTEAPTTEATAPATTTATTEPENTAETTVPDDAGGEPECAYLGVDSFDDMQVELTFINPIAADGPIEVTYGLNDGGGTRFTTSVEFVQHALAAERFRIDADTLENRPEGMSDDDITCEILSIEEGFGSDDVATAGDGDTCSFVEVDSFDDIQIELAVANPHDDTGDLLVLVALYGDGVRFGETTAIIDAVAPGETVRSDEDTLTEFPPWADESSFSCAVLTIERF